MGIISDLVEVDRQDRDIRDWFNDQHIGASSADADLAIGVNTPELWTFTQAFYNKAQVVLTYWPYPQRSIKYHSFNVILKMMLELPSNTPDVATRISKHFRPNPAISTIERKMKRLNNWILLFDFDRILAWGPVSNCLDPVAFLIAEDKIPPL